MTCIRCKQPLPPEREPYRAHAECVTTLPKAGSGPLPRSGRVPYGRFPTTAKGCERMHERAKAQKAGGG